MTHPLDRVRLPAQDREARDITVQTTTRARIAAVLLLLIGVLGTAVAVHLEATGTRTTLGDPRGGGLGLGTSLPPQVPQQLANKPRMMLFPE
jgi:hypothetical protein